MSQIKLNAHIRASKKRYVDSNGKLCKTRLDEDETPMQECKIWFCDTIYNFLIILTRLYEVKNGRTIFVGDRIIAVEILVPRHLSKSKLTKPPPRFKFCSISFHC